MGSLGVVGTAGVVDIPGDGPVRGEGFRTIQSLPHVSVSCLEDAIVSVGPAESCDVEIDAAGCIVVPGFVDCHTHLPFYGWRADEDAARLSGTRYEDLHAGQGGIYRSARQLAEASDDAVLAFSETLARAMLATGTTAFETKSGYGLSVEAELRQLRIARSLGARVPQTVLSTCLAAHAVPHDTTEGQWIGVAANELLPRAAEEGLAEACDIYVETIAFDLEHAARLAETASGLGWRMRVHADQLADNQTASFAARWDLASADHLNHTSRDAVDDLAGSDTAAVLLPGATFTLRQAAKPPARALIDAGAIVALGTDLNPGTSPVSSLPFVIALACRTYGLAPLEALAAATANAAYVLGIDDRVGRISPGRRADLLVLDVASFDEVPYRPDRNPVAVVVCGGEVAHVAPGFESRVSPVPNPVPRR